MYRRLTCRLAAAPLPRAHAHMLPRAPRLGVCLGVCWPLGRGRSGSDGHEEAAIPSSHLTVRTLSSGHGDVNTDKHRQGGHAYKDFAEHGPRDNFLTVPNVLTVGRMVRDVTGPADTLHAYGCGGRVCTCCLCLVLAGVHMPGVKPSSSTSNLLHAHCSDTGGSAVHVLPCAPL